MRNYETELKSRIAFIRDTVGQAGAKGIVFGNSGGKDSALVGILCKMACPETVGVIMPCAAKRNYGADRDDAESLAGRFEIEMRLVDLTETREEMLRALAGKTELTDAALVNIAPRLRMAALYAIAGSEGRLVAGTDNRSEMYMGYFTKWGDGAYDFNPIADLTVTEVYEFLEFLNAPEAIIKKAPSAGLFDGQTDEGDMGVTYRAIDDFLLKGVAGAADRQIIEGYHRGSAHKRRGALLYGDGGRAGTE